MAKSDYLPTRDNDFLVWHDQFKAGLTAQAATFDLTEADTTALANENTELHAKISAAAAAAAAAQQTTKEKTAARQAIERRVRALARRLKAHPAYTPALGAQLGIEGPEDTTDLSASKPQLSATDQTGGVVELAFSKSRSDGVNLYSQRDGEAGFVFLARDTSSPYLDNRPLLAPGRPEVRRYKAVYVLNDQEIGQFSDEVTVTCRP
ncbi:MAG: hypothetical protein M1541_21090 [Acidobacteria bacterium]|nr:hypothetical protein [Acidobacteriota bacterium]